MSTVLPKVRKGDKVRVSFTSIASEDGPDSDGDYRLVGVGYLAGEVLPDFTIEVLEQPVKEGTIKTIRNYINPTSRRGGFVSDGPFIGLGDEWRRIVIQDEPAYMDEIIAAGETLFEPS